MNIEKLVVKIGGSILFPENVKPEHLKSQIQKLNNFINTAKNAVENLKLSIIVGGGFWAKSYIKFTEELGISPLLRDVYGIEISRLNANVVLQLLTKMGVYSISPTIPKSPIEAFELSKIYDIIILGGFYPGQSTIGTAALLSEVLNADLLLIGTDVNGVYLEDPKVNPNAKKLDKVNIDELKKILLEYESKPGTYKLIDFVALKTLERSKIPTIIFDGRDLNNLERVFFGILKDDFSVISELGTMITF